MNQAHRLLHFFLSHSRQAFDEDFNILRAAAGNMELYGAILLALNYKIIFAFIFWPYKNKIPL